ncbi:vacuolar protein sorting-associated protein 53-like protein [Euroglyphus maynei]|uniref:Vacuolar protein sorting-associated protein 53 homolog n=1 Tax=Euroglyphus maynei TaxID=6958 RepID=A0A1Y3BRP0_EURMA|nr:vacuolar protein sorting-associated protein 53-like protein [Euroglyphus maynei]
MLNNLHILVQGTFILKETTKKRQYGTASKTLQGILDVLKQFDRFKHIPHISKLTSDIDETCNLLGEQILGDFRETFESKNMTKALSQNQTQLLAEGCLVLSILEPKYKRQLITWLVDLELAEYKALFQDNQDIAWLDKIDSRFSWLKKHLIVFEDKIGFLFPPNWEISECIAVEFCKITRQDLIQVMNNRFIELDVNILLPAISKATAFEKLLHQRFTGATIRQEKSNSHHSKNVFSGLITNCFENYLNIYVEAQDKNFDKLINQFVEERTKQSTNNQELAKAEIFASSGKLFTQYKNCLIQCISLSNRLPLVLLSNTFQKYLREYAHKILQNTIPRVGSNVSLASSLTNTITNTGASGVFSAASSAANLIQIFSKDLDNKCYSNSEIKQICSIILTSNYCLETTQQLEKKIQEKIDPSLMEKIVMNVECDIFHGIISNCIQLLSHSVENSCEQPLNVMIKTQWANMGTPIGHSQYVSTLILTLQQLFPLIRENLSDVFNYYHQFCQKFIQSFISKFISNIFKCKPLSQGAAEQLLLDAHTLKKILLELPEYKSNNDDHDHTIPSSYTSTVITGMTKAEMILKILLVPVSPAEMFVENYFKLFQEKDMNEFQKIIEMKGIRKSESFTLIELFKKKMLLMNNNYEKKNYEIHCETDSNSELSVTSIDSNRIKKLEKLIKNRL